MGLLARFDCEACGYRSGELTLGPAPRPEEFDPVLVSCPGCKTLRDLDERKVAAGCRSHRKPYTVYGDDEAVCCPKCGQEGDLDMIAIWD